MTRPYRHSAGFTLLELMVTVSVAAIVLGLGVPAFTDVIRNNRLTTSANDLLRSTQLARSEAVKRQTSVVVCATADSSAPTPTCNDGDFRDWMVFVDTNGNWVADAAEPVIERHGAIPAAVTVRTDQDGIISYSPSGFTPPAPTPKQPTRNIVFCDQRGNQQIGTNSTARALMVSQTGRTRVTKDRTQVGLAITAAGDCP